MSASSVVGLKGLMTKALMPQPRARRRHAGVEAANFRETQLERVRPGQAVTVHGDAVDSDFAGKVESIAAATGARYSLLPPENASGNYVKVVQRMPVRIALLPGQSGFERLRPGMSVEPQVRVK
jgi:membrane fusion protein (multidrug efflux system)